VCGLVDPPSRRRWKRRKQNAGVTPSARVGDGSGPSVLVLEITVDESPAGFLPDDG